MTTLLIVAVALWPVLWCIRVLFVTRLLMGLELRRARCQPVETAALPPHFQRAAKPWVTQLTELGYTATGGWILNVTGDAAFDECAVVMEKPGQAVRAVIQSYGDAARSGECWATLRTTTMEGVEIVTASHAPEPLLPPLPAVQVEVIEAGSPMELIQRHHQRINGLGNLWSCPGAASAAQREAHIRDSFLGAAQASGVVSQSDAGVFTYRLGPALKRAHEILHHAAKAKKQQASTQRSVISALAPDDQIEFDLQQYRQQGALLRGRFSLKAKTMLALGSFVLFAAVMAWQYSVVVAATLIVALIVHEGGHLAGMRWFGFRDTQLLFVPFFGGAAIGHDDKVLAPWKHIVIVLLGPMPGIFLALLLLVYTSGGQAPAWVDTVAWTTLVLNGFNLLPILPLDGGQIVDFAIASRLPRARVLFQGLSALGLTLLGLLGGGARLLFGLGVASLIRLPLEWRLAGVRRSVREEFPEGGDEEPVVRRLLQELRTPEWAKVSISQRLQLIRGLQKVLRMPKPRFGTMIFAVAAFTAPVWLGAPLAIWAATRQGEAHVQQAYARAAAAGITTANSTPQPSVAPEDNAALLYDQALALSETQDDESGEPRAPAANSKILTLLRAAAQKSAFVPAAKAKRKDGKPSFQWSRSALVSRLTQAAGERWRFHEGEKALGLAIDALKLLRLMQTVPDYLAWYEYQYVADSAWRTIEEVVATGVKLTPERAGELQRLAREETDLAFAAYALPRALVDPTLGRTEEAAEAMGSSGWLKVAELISRANPTWTKLKVDSIDAGVELHGLMQGVVRGEWPAPVAADDQHLLSAHASLVTLADFVARQRLARVALRLVDERQRGRPAKELSALGFSAPELAHPYTRVPIVLSRRGDFDTLSYASAAPRTDTDAEPAEADEDTSEPVVAWRIPATAL